MKNMSPLEGLILLCFCCCFTPLWAFEAEEAWGSNLVVKKDERRTVLETEFGEITAVEIGDAARINGSFHLQFFKLEPNALFLPVMLHSEMLLYCHSGSGDLIWIGQGKKSTTISVSRGDVYRLRQGSVFFIRSNLGTDQRDRLRITALFTNSNEDLHSGFSSLGPYSSIAELVRGFDSSVLQAAFQVPEEVIQTIKSAAKQPLIIQDVSSQQEEGTEGQSWGWEGRFMRVYMSLEGAKMENKKKKKHKESKSFNVYTADRDFENCNGWSLTVSSKDLEVLNDSEFGAFYVNLTKGAMMAPHWNPMATEVAFVVAGQGMVRVVCSSSGNQSGCENQSFKVEEGDVFMVPRFHPMSQTSFNNDSFVFMGFSTSGERNYPQYLVGKQSVFQVIDKDVLAAAFNVDNETVVQLSGQQQEALIVECTSCAEEQFSVLQEEEMKRREEEEARKREEEEEERKRREEEEARKREEEEEERKRREEEEARKREKEEEERKRREEEEARKREEERKRREEEEARKREEEEEARKEEERAEQERRQREEEEERAEQERRQREEEARRQEKEEPGRGGGGESEEEAARRQEEERERREREEEQGRGGGGSSSHGKGEEAPSGAPEERQTRRHARRERHQRQEEEGGGQGESEGEAAMRQEEERIRREREQTERGRSAEAPIVLVDNLDKVMDALF